MIRAVLLAILAVLGPSPALAETFDGRRAVIIDGDTFALGSERVRILNIDAPETRGSRCEWELVLGLKAKERLAGLLRAGSAWRWPAGGRHPRHPERLSAQLATANAG